MPHTAKNAAFAVMTTLITLGSSTSSMALEIVWDSTDRPYPGVEIKRGHTDSPQRYFWATYVDLCTSYVHVDATGPASQRQTTGSWASGVGAQVAINGDFFEYSTPPSVYGDAVGGGVRWPASQTGIDNSGSWYYRNYGWIALGDGWVEFTHTERTKQNAQKYIDAGFTVSDGFEPRTVTTQIPPGTRALVSGFPALVIEGKLRTCPDPAGGADCFGDRGDMRDRHVRSAIGITADRKQLIFITTTSSVYGHELAEIIYDAGAWQAFNLDGGGSTSLWTEAAGYIVPGGSPRAVGNHWGIWAGASAGVDERPSSCLIPGGCNARPVAGTDTSDFGDYRTEWLGYAATRTLYDQGAFNTCGAAEKPLLCPLCVMTRSEFAYSVARVAGLSLDPPASPSFDDVPPTHPHYAEIEAFAAAGITNGCGERRFCPENPVKRAQAAAFLRRAAGLETCPPASPSFDDVPADHLFYAEIEAIASACITNGCSDTSFCPDRELKRQEAALFITRAFDIEDANSCLDRCAEGGVGGIDVDCDGAPDSCDSAVDPGGDGLANSSMGPENPDDSAYQPPTPDGQPETDPTGSNPDSESIVGEGGCATPGSGHPVELLVLLAQLALIGLIRSSRS